MATLPHTALPLETLLQRLHQQEVAVPPDVYLRLQRALHLLPRHALADRHHLRSLLAPLIATNQQEQQTFYDTFDAWWDEHVAPPPPPEPPPTPRPRNPWPWVALGLLGILAIAWIIGTSTSEPLRKPATYFESSPCLLVGQPTRFLTQTPELAADSSLRFRWEFGDGTVDSTHRNPEHTFSQVGYRTVTLTVWNAAGDSSFTRRHFVQPGPLNADFRIDTLRPANALVDIPEFRFVPLQAPDSNKRYAWQLGGSRTSTTYSPRQSYETSADEVTISLRVRWKQDTAGLCERVSSQPLRLEEKPVELPAMAPLRDPRPGKVAWTGLPYLSLALLLLMAWAGVEGYRRYRRRPRLTPDFQQALQRGQSPPYRLPFPRQNLLIRPGPDLYRLADLLRRRRESRRQRLDVPATLWATVKAGGFPELRYRTYTRPTSYLALVDKHHPEDQQAQLFEQLIALLQREEVDIEVCTFRDDPRYLYHPQYPEGLPVERVQRMYPEHRLLIFGRGDQLLSPFDGRLQPWVPKLFEGWQEKAWLTPVPVGDWGLREQQLHRQFLLLPADLQGQLELVETFEQRQTLDPEQAETPAEREDFHGLRDRLLLGHPQREAVRGYDFQRVEDLKAYLGEELFEWLAATALYPRPRWELTLALGHALQLAAQEESEETDAHSTYEPTYDSLLRLSRVPWLQTGELPERLRAELMETLTPEQERVARSTILELLEEAELAPAAYASQEREVQRVIQRAKLHPEDSQAQAQLQLLLAQGLLDPVTASQQQAQAATAFNWNRFVLRAGVGLITVLLLFMAASMWLGWQERNDKLASWQQAAPWLQAAGLLTEQLDSAVYYNNLGVSRVEAGDTAEARALFEQALRYQILKDTGGIWRVEDSVILYPQLPRNSIFDPRIGQNVSIAPQTAYPLATYNLHSLRYLQARIAYNNQASSKAFSGFLGLTKWVPNSLWNASLATEASSIKQSSYPHFVVDSSASPALHPLRADTLFLHSLHGLGLLSLDNGDLEAARQALEYLLALSPTYFDAFGSSLLTRLGTAEQRDQLRATRIRQADSLFEAKDFAEARRLYALLLEAEPDNEAWAERMTEAEDSLNNRTSRPQGWRRIQAPSPPNPSTQVAQVLARWMGIGYLKGVPSVLIRTEPSTQASTMGRVDEATLTEIEDVFFEPSLLEAEIATRRRARAFAADGTYEAPANTPVQVLDQAAPDHYLTIAIQGKPAFIRKSALKEVDGNYWYQINSEGWMPAENFLFTTDADLLPRYLPGEAGTSVGGEDVPTTPTQDLPRFIAPQMVTVPGGTFQMGDVFGDGENDDEIPVHLVEVSTFQLSAFEVTFEEYDLYCEATGRPKPEDEGWGRGKRPVINVDWYDALLYCNWLSRQQGLGEVYRIDSTRQDPNNQSSLDDKKWLVNVDWSAKGYRLPTEAEWEYAARQAGDTVRFGDGRNTADAQFINFDASEDYKQPYSKVGVYRGQTVPVNTLGANSLGLYHMSGNVYEWCQDWYDSDYYETCAKQGIVLNPKGPKNGSSRVLRGGSWGLNPSDCRSANRNSSLPDLRSSDLGFRCARAQ